ncbi:type VI secretion system protein TssA [Nitrogeniibacter mangrovi]|uniref:Type VI secretion system protein TssA n=1 Tax=Nitrogeniibacter mangrovi TaxID=2016596 RepID=A0A6C1B597_9RHOO|nr:type VI secretion system protein TssA [Nitrogeniibacter mangrovi]QID17460.1 type VI secretion system protein TssA [Nitrogeniibacter mangrovi]
MNLNELLAPLAGPSPCGEDMLFSEAFDRIAQMRRFDDPSLSQGEWQTELKEADWGGVVRECAALLSTQTKDLRLAVWMTEALTLTRGFGGLAQGYALTAGLVEGFWETVHPLPDEDDQEQRIGVLGWLLGQSERLIRQVPITDSPRGRYNSLDLVSVQALAQAMERAPGEAEILKAQARLTQDDFEAARRDTAGAFFAQAVAAAQSAGQALAKLETAIDARLGMDGPSFSSAREALDGVIDQLGRYAREAGVHAAVDGTGAAPEKAAAELSEGAMPLETHDPAPSASLTVGTIRSRAQAIGQLKAVAEFFRRTEPHSPVAYLADKAARWGDMSLHEWLRTVVKDDGALAHVEELLGVPSKVVNADEDGYR